jgi:hypothetical protein
MICCHVNLSKVHVFGEELVVHEGGIRFILGYVHLLQETIVWTDDDLTLIPASQKYVMSLTELLERKIG